MGTTWRESDFQKWLEHHPSLPGIGDLLLAKQAVPVKRQVDMLFLSGDGALVLVEVKNERTGREVIGQALEYAARLQDATLAEVTEIYDIQDPKELCDKFHQQFGRPLTLSSKRHVVIVAPDFDVTCHVTVPYLRRLAEHKGVEFHLVRAVPGSTGFDLKRDTELVPTSRMPALSCGVSLRGTLDVVFKGGARPVLWRVGKIHDSDLSPRESGTLRFADQLLRPLEGSPRNLRLSESGNRWTKRGSPQDTVVVLGVFSEAGGDMYHLVRFHAGAYKRLQKKPAADLEKDWTQNSTEPGGFDWYTLQPPTGSTA